MRACRVLIVVYMAAMAGCGRMAPLKPAQGEPLPVKPLMAQTTPTAEDLLELPTYANPQRVDELIRRSQPRPIDRFDLPPAGGGAAPDIVGTDNGDDASSNQVGPVTPQ
jgi:predicted small lipoprotein YifL